MAEFIVHYTYVPIEAASVAVDGKGMAAWTVVKADRRESAGTALLAARQESNPKAQYITGITAIEPRKAVKR